MPLISYLLKAHPGSYPVANTPALGGGSTPANHAALNRSVGTRSVPWLDSTPNWVWLVRAFPPPNAAHIRDISQLSFIPKLEVIVLGPKRRWKKCAAALSCVPNKGRVCSVCQNGDSESYGKNLHPSSGFFFAMSWNPRGRASLRLLWNRRVLRAQGSGRQLKAQRVVALLHAR